MTNYFIDATLGNNANNGLSEATPWATISKVNGEVFQAGDIINFKRGEIWIGTALKPPSSGCCSNPITFQSYGSGALPHINGNAVVRCVDMGTAKSHLVFQDLRLTNAASGSEEFRARAKNESVIGLVLRGLVIEGERCVLIEGTGTQAAYNDILCEDLKLTPAPSGAGRIGIHTVRTGRISDFVARRITCGPAGEDGITIEGVTRGTVEFSSFGGNGENSIDVKDSTSINIRYNICDMDQESNIVVHEPDGGPTADIVLEGNICKNGGAGGSIRPGILILDSVARCTIRYNQVTGANGAGIEIQGTSDALVAYNLVASWGSGAFSAGVQVGQAASAPQVHDNIIIGDGVNTNRCMWFQSSSDAVVRNNISIAPANQHIAVDSNAISGFVADRNCYDSDNGTQFRWDSVNVNFATWKTNSGQDTNACILNPLFAKILQATAFSYEQNRLALLSEKEFALEISS